MLVPYVRNGGVQMKYLYIGIEFRREPTKTVEFSEIYDALMRIYTEKKKTNMSHPIYSIQFTRRD